MAMCMDDQPVASSCKAEKIEAWNAQADDVTRRLVRAIDARTRGVVS